MPNVRITTFRGIHATTKYRFVPDREHGYVHPGEIVDVPQEVLDLPAHQRALEAGLIAITQSEPNRPFLYDSEGLAKRRDPRNENASDADLQREADRIALSQLITERERKKNIEQISMKAQGGHSQRVRAQQTD